MASEYDDEDDWVDDWDDEGTEDRPRNRLAEALTVFGLTVPLALLLVTVRVCRGFG